MRLVTVAATAVVLAGLAAVPTAVASPASPAGSTQPSTAMHPVVSMHSAHGVKVTKVQRIGQRQLQVSIVPTALGRAIAVRIVLPVGYQPDRERRYPVLYLFPGTSGHSYDWATVGQAPKTTRPYGLITVSSDIGFDGDGGSWFTNWVDRHTALGKSQWERYDIHQLIPWIDANLDTIANRSGRAVAGLSQGGYGAAELAARHPDLFTMMGSFSGAPEIDRDLSVRVGAAAIIDATMVGLNGVPANAPFGDHVKDEINWKGHDPARLLDNLRGMKLWMATADGLPGKYDDPVTNPQGVVTGGVIESLTHVSTDTFHQHLIDAHIPSTFYDYGRGTHTWPYWARDFRRFISPLMHRFAHPARRRNVAHYTTIQKHWSEWGWRVRDHRPTPLVFANLTHATSHGFSLVATGVAHVRTPRDYTPGAKYAVTVGHRRTHPTTANHRGQLNLTLRYGGTTPHDLTVTIAAA